MCQKLSIVCLALPVVTGCRRNIISYFLIFDRIFSFKKCNTVFMQHIYKHSFIHWYEIYEISHWDVSFLISNSNLSVAFGRHRKDLKTLIFQLFGYWNVCFHFYSDRDALKNAKYIIFVLKFFFDILNFKRLQKRQSAKLIRIVVDMCAGDLVSFPECRVYFLL